MVLGEADGQLPQKLLKDLSVFFDASILAKNSSTIVVILIKQLYEQSPDILVQTQVDKLS